MSFATNREAYGLVAGWPQADWCFEELGSIWYIQSGSPVNIISGSPSDGCKADPGPHCGTGNLVLQDTIERLFAQSLYADINRGVYLVRGENIVIMGEIVRWIALAPRSASLSTSTPNSSTSSPWTECLHPTAPPSRTSTKTTTYPHLSNKHHRRPSTLYKSKKRKIQSSEIKPDSRNCEP